MARKGVSWTQFGIAMAIMALITIAVGLLVYFFACPEKNAQQSPSAPTKAPPLYPIQRLPQSLKPTLYQLSVQPYFPAPGISYSSDQNFTFDGSVTITIQCREATDKVILHMHNINLINESIHLWDVTSDPMEVKLAGYTYDPESFFVTFPASPALQPSHTYRLQMNYIGQLIESDLAGFYPSSYIENGETHWMAVTQMESTDARRALPCFDEPNFKAIFEVQIVHPSSMKALSNAMETRTDAIGNGWSRTAFEPTEKMSTYLLAMAVCAFEAKTSYTKDHKVMFRVWARPSFINETDYAVYAGPKVLDYYSEYFNISFPLKKQDMLAIPDFSAGAMENWGLVTYREDALLYDQNVYSSEKRQRVAVVIAHELSHQWFGDLVTMDWWDDVWLNEGFATYMEYIGTDDISDGDFHMDQQFVGNLAFALQADQLSSSHPIVNPLTTLDDISAMFDDISYNKGGAVLQMLSYTISKPIFQAGLEIYLSQNSYGNAIHTDLWAALTEAVITNGSILDWSGDPLNVSEYMNTWTLQMGYPILTIKRDNDKKRATVTQQRFVLPGNFTRADKSSPFNYTWYVPLWYQHENDSEIKFSWLVPYQTLQIPAPENFRWMLLNYDTPGFFRVNYDQDNWRLLQDQLRQNFEIINIKNRAQLIDDALSLARAGYLDYSIALDTTVYLTNESSYIPWSSAMNSFGYLRDMLLLSADYQLLKNYLTTLMTPMYDETGWNDDVEPIDDVLSHYRRSLSKITLCRFGHVDCLDHAKNLFAEFFTACHGAGAISSECSKVPPNFRQTVYCAGGEDGNDDWWNLLWDLQAKEPVSAEKDYLLYGLCCTRSPSLLTRLLDEGINPNSAAVRRQDSRFVFKYVGENEIGQVLLWPYVEDNWPVISESARNGVDSPIEALVNAATRSFNTEYQAKMLEDFYTRNFDQLGSAAASVQQQIEKVNANVEWVKDYRSNVVRWLANATS